MGYFEKVIAAGKAEERQTDKLRRLLDEELQDAVKAGMTLWSIYRDC